MGIFTDFVCFLELSEVLWKMVLQTGLKPNGAIGVISTYVNFFSFGVLTFSILVLMEGLSAFLHALRLHWYIEKRIIFISK
jgi:V-type H+-transporting ATPase subunit a